MKTMRLIAVSLACVAILGMASGWQVFAAATLTLNPLGEMVVADATGQTVKTLVLGSVGEVARVGTDSFKISYGKDLQGRSTAILYANPEDPQPFTVNCQGQDIVVSKEAVLTLILDSNGTLVQAGILGQITVSGQKLAPQETLRISNSGTIVADTAPAPANPAADKLAVSASTVSASAGTAAPIVDAKPVAAPAPTPRGPIGVGLVVGRVFVDSDDGKGEQPLTGDSVVKIGSVIRTEKNSSAELKLFPDVTATVYQNSTLFIRDHAYTPGNAPHRKFVGVLTKGKLHNNLDVKGKGKTDYEIETPHQSFFAIGTDFLVTLSEDDNTSFVQVYEGVVGANDGTKIYARVQGLYTNTGRPPEFTPMSDQEHRTWEERRRGRDYARGNANGQTPAADQSYVQTPTSQDLDNIINQSQRVFQPRLNKPITPFSPNQ